MTTTLNNTNQFDSVITSAAQLLSQRMGTPVQLTNVVCISEEERRNRLLRCRVDNPPPGLPTSLIIKQVVAKAYNPDQIDSWDTQRFFRDWVGAEFLSNLPATPHMAHAFTAVTVSWALSFWKIWGKRITVWSSRF